MLDRIEQKIVEIIESKKDEIMAFGTDIWNHAELGYKEVRTSGKFVEEMAKLGEPPVKSEGMKNPDWALVDFDGVMLHIFSTQMRDFYGLDNLWADAVKIEIDTIDEV